MWTGTLPAAVLLAMLLAGSASAESVDFTLPDLQGEPHSLSDYRGKWVVVNYWATWCPPCLDEIPELVDFHERHRDGNAVVLGVNHEDISPQFLRSFVDMLKITYPVLRSEPLPDTPLGPVPGLPTTYIISPEGERVARQVGPVTAQMIEQYIQAKIRERQANGAAAGGAQEE